MEKKNIKFIVVTIVVMIVVLICTMYIIDRNRMKDNKPVVFSTWGYKYAPPVENVGGEVKENKHINVTNRVYLDNEQKISIELPEKWHYENVTDLTESTLWKTKIYPNELERDTYFSIYKSNNFGVCGTGLEVKKITLNNSKTASVGYYDGSLDWNYAVINLDINLDEDIVAINTGLQEDFAKNALEILKTIQYE